jgi:class 3 adenylate cyclase/tetratricopeptide (TPR) repeat protein
MQCPRCHYENPGGGKFCGECGARLELLCAVCQAANPPNHKFCQECGEPLATAAPTRPAVASPAYHTPKHLAERILTSRGALEGERKQVTVLFADLKGSMELLADRDPEEARRILDPVLERMMEAVHRYEGTVNQVMGDGIMALFGAPLAHEDHAVRACYAALRMQEAVKQYAEEVRRAEGALPQIRVGLNSGEVVVRSIGSDLRMDYTAVGQTTHLAARMEQLAAPGSILLAPETLCLAEGYVQVQALGPMQIKGLSEPVEVYELLGAGFVRSRLQASAARGFTKFVGRDAELETLRRTLGRAGAGQGQIVALVGEPGVGKSRLTWEFTHSHRTHDWLVLDSGSVSYGKATSYLPVTELLKGYCGIETRDDVRRIREKVAGKVLLLDEALRPTLPALLALLDVPVEDAAWQALDPLQRRQRTLDGVKRLLLRESQVQPLLLVFEDLHWIDAETQALLDSLSESLPTTRILLLVNYRPEYEHAWHGKTYYQQLRLDPLPPEGTDALLAALLGDADDLQALKRGLIARTEGNPLFVEESVRALVETGALVGERGAYRLASPLKTTQMPATVQAVLAARIDRLAPEDKRLLQSAAVIGKDVPYPLLQAIAEVPEEGLREGLTRLQAAELLYETSLFPDLEYTFKHALTHEVAYGSLLQERRRALHARIVEAIEALYAERLGEYVERLAHHAVRGEAWEKAVSYLHQSGAHADARSAPREAVACYEQALQAVGHLPPSRGLVERAVDLHLDLRTSLQPLGEFDRIVHHLQEAEALAGTLDDQRRLGRLWSGMSSYYWQTGDYERATVLGERAVAIAVALGDLPLRATSNQFLGRAYGAQGDYPRAMECFTWTIGVLEGDLLHERFGLPYVLAVNARCWMAVCLADQGDFARGVGPAEESIQIAEAADDSFSLLLAASAVGHLYVTKGDFQKAIPALERGMMLSETCQFPVLFPWVASLLGYAYVQSERLGDGLLLLEQAVERAAARKLGGRSSRSLADLGEAYLLAGRKADASEVAERALTQYRGHKERGNEAGALRLLGDVAACADPSDVERAEAYYREALALAEELGMRPLVAHCHLDLGSLYQRLGRAEEARGELVTAADLYRAMEMAFWLGRAEDTLAQVAG